MSGEPQYYTNNKGERIRIYGGGSYDILNPIGDWFQNRIRQINQPLSPERQRRKEAQIRINEGQGTDADRRLLGIKPKTEQKDEPTFGRPGINPKTGKPYSESPGKSSVAPSASDNDPNPTNINRDVDRGGAKGTQTSPSPANFPTLIQSLQQNHGFINPYSSIKLPAQPAQDPIGLGSATIADGRNAGLTVNTNNPDYEAIADGEIQIGTKETLIDGQKETLISNSALAETDQGRAMQTGLSAALADKEGMRSYMQNLYGGRDAQYDRRGAAFLQGDSSLMGLRQAEFAQGYIRQNGKNYAVDSSGNVKGEFSDAGRQQLIKQGYGSAAGQEFLDRYTTNAAAAQSADSVSPAPASMDMDAMRKVRGAVPKEALQVPEGINMSREAGASALNPDNFINGDFTYGLREPLMRF